MNKLQIMIAMLTHHRKKISLTAAIIGMVGLIAILVMITDGEVHEPWAFIPAGVMSSGVLGLWEFRFD